MRIIICPDSFKGSLTAAEAALAIDSGAARALPDSDRQLIPLADGGEGTVQSIVSATDGEIVRVLVTGPVGRPIEACYGLIDNGTVAVIEMSAAAGLNLIAASERNPRLATSYGVGELILDAYNRGCRKFIIGLGGSATNDGGAGALSALGVRFLDANGCELPPGGASLVKLGEIDTSGIKIDVETIDVRAACDVTNPLIGPNGASAVYGPQKGASPEVVALLDQALVNYAQVIERRLDIDIANTPGAGAAGGLGAGLMAFLEARLESGIDIVLDVTRFDERIRGADLIITGEGRVDSQTMFGKTIFGVLKRATMASVPVVILAGSVGEGIEPLYSLGASAIFSVASGPISEEESISRASELLAASAENAVRLFAASKR
jgi:glycerate kinase